MTMNDDQHDHACRLALARLEAKNWQIDNDDDLIALALVSNYGRGPWESQAKRITEWANEREERFIAVRAVLDSYKIGTWAGKLEDQVKALAQDRYHVGRNHEANQPRNIAKEILDRISDLAARGAFNAPFTAITELRKEFEP